MGRRRGRWEVREETMTEKRCPILMIALSVPGGDWSNPFCIGEYCAWWNEDFECCGLIAQGVIWGLEVSRKESDRPADVNADYPYGGNERVEGE